MPGSSDLGKEQFVNFIKNNKFEHILDVGPGWGTYGKIIRNLELNYNPKISCIEIFERYLSDYNLYEIYDEVILGDIRNFINYEKYDLLIFGDILEHMVREDMLKILEDIKKYDNLTIFISIPIIINDKTHQGAAFGNIYETHLEEWTYNTFLDYCGKFDVEINLNDIIGIFVKSNRNIKGV